MGAPACYGPFCEQVPGDYEAGGVGGEEARVGGEEGEAVDLGLVRAEDVGGLGWGERAWRCICHPGICGDGWREVFKKFRVGERQVEDCWKVDFCESPQCSGTVDYLTLLAFEKFGFMQTGVPGSSQSDFGDHLCSDKIHFVCSQ